MATRFFSKHALNIFSLELELWEFPLHTHNFYELIFILEGSGIHIVNEVSLSYKQGDIFLLTAKDEHRFTIEEKTKFTFVKFTEQLFVEKTENNAIGKWQSKINAVLCNPNSNPNSIVNQEEEKTKMFTLLSLLQNEYENVDFFSRQVVLDLFGAMITIVARSLNETSNLLSFNVVSEIDKVSQIIGYIRQHIFEKDRLSIEALSEKFNLSKNYTGTYIKKHTGVTLQHIILETKFKTADRLSCSSSIQIKARANRLEFNDLSHFSRLFKKYNGNTPSIYRKLNRKK